jgi:hypothetical protein
MKNKRGSFRLDPFFPLSHHHYKLYEIINWLNLGALEKGMTKTMGLVFSITSLSIING